MERIVGRRNSVNSRIVFVPAAKSIIAHIKARRSTYEGACRSASASVCAIPMATSSNEIVQYRVYLIERRDAP